MRGRTTTTHIKPISALAESTTPESVQTVPDTLWPILDALELDALEAMVVFDLAGQRIEARGALADVLGCEASKLPTTFEAMHGAQGRSSWSLEVEQPVELAQLWSAPCVRRRAMLRTASRSWAVICRWRPLRMAGEPIALLATYTPAPQPLRSDLLTRWPMTGLLRVDATRTITWLDERAAALLGLAEGTRLPLTERLALRVPEERAGCAISCPLEAAFDAAPTPTLLWVEGAHEARLVQFDPRWAGQELLVSVQDVTDTYFHIQRREEFLFIASHELRAPLTPLRGFVQMALDAHRQGEEVVGLLERANGQVRRLARMVDVLLDMSRVESGKMTRGHRPLDLHQLIARTVAAWPTSETAQRLVLRGAAQPVVIDGDELALEQVLVNLIENAVKFSPPHTPIELHVEQIDQIAVLRVQDHGPGMDARMRARVFDRFFQGPSARREAGVGLGLYISRRIVEEHGGTIEVSGDNAQGTVVDVRLPMSESTR
jgi:signal transduction histidine kinase